MNKRVLIVDDASFMRKMIKDILVEADCEIVGEAKNGEEAVKLYKKLTPDLVTMDINMPKKNGITAVKEIIKEDSRANILVCSAINNPLTINKVITLGAKNFITKPFQPKTILKTIDEILD